MVIPRHGFLRKSRRHVVEQIIQPQAVLGGDGKDVFDPQAMKFSRQRLVLLRVNLVHHHSQGFSGAAQELRQLLIQRHHAFAAVHHENQVRGFLNRYLRLAINFDGDQLLVRGDNAPGVNDLERLAQPLGVSVEAVTGHARLVAHQRPALFAKAIEQRGLAYVGPAENHDAWKVRHRSKSKV